MVTQRCPVRGEMCRQGEVAPSMARNGNREGLCCDGHVKGLLLETGAAAALGMCCLGF